MIYSSHLNWILFIHKKTKILGILDQHRILGNRFYFVGKLKINIEHGFCQKQFIFHSCISANSLLLDTPGKKIICLPFNPVLSGL